MRPPLATTWRKLQRRASHWLYWDHPKDPARSILLAGSGRSGSTWVSDVINARNDLRTIFEPFHPQRVALCRHFPRRLYLRPDSAPAEYVEPIERILAGRIRGWPDAQNRCLWPRGRLIKVVRAQLFLRWIAVRHPEVALVYLIRNPFAVVASRLAVRWRAPLRWFLEQPELVEDHLAPHRARLEAAESRFERHMLMWCVENFVPLRQFAAAPLYVLFYENLVSDPEASTRALYEHLGLRFAPALLREISIPSVVSRPDSAVHSGEDRLASWRKHLEPPQIAQGLDILRSFGLHALYGEDGLPGFADGPDVPRRLAPSLRPPPDVR